MTFGVRPEAVEDLRVSFKRWKTSEESSAVMRPKMAAGLDSPYAGGKRSFMVRALVSMDHGVLCAHQSQNC